MRWMDEVETELKSAHYNIPLSHSHTTTTTKTIFRAPLSADQKIINITSHDQRPQHDTRRDVKRKNQIHLQLRLQLQLEPSQSQSHCICLRLTGGTKVRNCPGVRIWQLLRRCAIIRKGRTRQYYTSYEADNSNKNAMDGSMTCRGV